MTDNLARKQNNNIIKFNNGTVLGSIKTFLEIKKNKSINTYKNYLSWYEDFFLNITKKTMEDLTWEDILSINYRDIYSHRDYLMSERKNNNKSCNTKIIAIRSLWNHFYKRDNKEVDPTQVEIESLLEDNTVKYGALTEIEFNKLLEFCLDEKQKSLEKYYFFKLSIVTGYRKESILNSKWKDIKLQYDNKSNKEFHVLKVKDKGKILEKPLHPSFYQEICSLKNLSTQPNDRIINISDKTLTNVLNRFCEKNNISKGRNICLHSIKKTGMDMVYKNSGFDIVTTSKYGNHSSIKHTYETYLSQIKDFENNPSYTMFAKNNNMNKLKELSKDELLELIENSGDFVINMLSKNI